MSHSPPTFLRSRRAPFGSESTAVAVLPWTLMSIERSAAVVNASGSSRERRSFIVASHEPFARRVSWAQALGVSPLASALR